MPGNQGHKKSVSSTSSSFQETCAKGNGAKSPGTCDHVCRTTPDRMAQSPSTSDHVHRASTPHGSPQFPSLLAPLTMSVGHQPQIGWPSLLAHLGRPVGHQHHMGGPGLIAPLAMSTGHKPQIGGPSFVAHLATSIGHQACRKGGSSLLLSLVMSTGDQPCKKGPSLPASPVRMTVNILYMLKKNHCLSTQYFAKIGL